MKEILLFNRCLNVASIDFKTVNQLSITKGFVVDKRCCNLRVIEYLNSLPNNINTTFYKSWEDVTSKTRLELALDQLIHYSSTYGTGYTGTPYVPNDSPEVIDFTDCKIISPISVEEIELKIQGLLDSGIALSQDTLENCISLVREFSLILKLETIKNKEILMYLYKELNHLPDSEEEMVRFLIYLYTGKTLLIKSSDLIKEIKANTVDISNLVYRFGDRKLSSIFLRFKPLFLAMKKGNEVIINKLRRLAVHNHKPKVFGFWSNVLSDVSKVYLIEDHLSSLNNFKLISLMQAIAVRTAKTGIMSVVVRNGKTFTTEKELAFKEYYALLYFRLEDELTRRLSSKACKVKLPANINLTVPTSEKNFIGNVPFGSWIEPSEDAVVGINWKGEEGAQDLDLSLLDKEGNKIGWDSQFTWGDDRIVYSGDMTSANPEATELLYCKLGMPNGIIKVNCFNAEPDSKYTLFFAKCKDMEVEKNHMVNPNDVVFSTKLSITGEAINGLFVKGAFYFMNLNSGKGRVSHRSDHALNFIKHKEQTVGCFLQLKDTLKRAGFEIVETEPQLDLSNLDKSALIELFS